ncbi:MAG: AGE family epimerase/isomerase, partial [Solirubrobacterales bacterium]|nr:AGE family epimerase/isomerase [Solirubrobacterales bacterium]
GLNVLTARGPEPDRAARERILARLHQVRAARPRPALDTKRLTSWNALMISALAEAGAVVGDERLLDAARRCAEFVLGELRDERGRLLRSFNEGQARLDGYLEDHAFLLEALLALYEASFEQRWFAEARALADQMIERFGDPVNGGFYSTASDHERLIARRKELEDTPIPAGGSSAALGLLRLAALSGEYEYERRAVSVLRLVAEIAPRHPGAFGHLLLALHVHLAPMREVAIVGAASAPEETQRLVRVVRERHRPATVLAVGEEGNGRRAAVGLLAGRAALDGRATAYVCRRQSCLEPVTEPARLRVQLEPAAPGR